MAATRNQQPSFNLLTGEATSTTGSRPSLGPNGASHAPNHGSSIPVPPSASKRRVSTTASSLRRPTTPSLPLTTAGVPVRATIDNEALRAQINTLQYELNSLKAESALALESTRSETRELERRIDSEARRAADAEKRREDAVSKVDGAMAESRGAATRAENEKRVFEKRMRELEEMIREGREEVEDAKEESVILQRELDREKSDGASRTRTLEARIEELAAEMKADKKAAEAAGNRAKDAERRAGDLEGQLSKLKSAVEDADMLGVVKKQLGEQVNYVKKLEAENARLEREIRKVTRDKKAVEIVEEEKRTLETKLGVLADVRRELSESELRRQVLEDERRGWTSYLETEEAGFGSPEDMARAFVKERAERANLLEKLGQVQPELAAKDEAITTLEQDKSRLEKELKKLRISGSSTASGSESRIVSRLEKQLKLVKKEVEYLRMQIKSIDEVTIELDEGQKVQQASDQIAQFQNLVDGYQAELATLNAQLKQHEAQPAAAQQSPLKRSHDESGEPEDNERLGVLQRKLRSMSQQLAELETNNATLVADLNATQSQLAALRESSRLRSLEFRNNPTAQYEAIKLSQLRTLEEENAALLSQLRSTRPPPKLVPLATLASKDIQISELKDELAQRDKKQLRLKQIWSSKAVEFRQAVASLLGWDVSFLRNGKTQLSCIYYPTRIDEESGEEVQNSITFDGEEGTMKVSGGEKSAFAAELSDMMEFWIEGRKEVPCFLMAAGLEFAERKYASKEKERQM